MQICTPNLSLVICTISAFVALISLALVPFGAEGISITQTVMVLSLCLYSRHF